MNRSLASSRAGARVRAALARAVAIALAVSVGVGPVRADDRVVKIGLDLPLSGIDGASAIPARNAVRLAIDDANKRGLPGGFTFVLDDLDDAVQGKHDPAQGAQNMRTFADDPAVLAVVGPVNSNVAEAELPVSAGVGLPLVSMAATAVTLTRGDAAVRLRAGNGGRPTFFRVCATDDTQGAAVAAFARKVGVRRAFVIDDNESYGKGLADVFASAFPHDGGTIVGREHLTPFALDFVPLLTKVRATHPDAVFFGGIVSTGGGVLRKQMADAGLGKLPFFGGDGLASPEYVPLAGAGADDTYFTLIAPDVSHLAAAKTFVADYRTRFHSDPGTYSPGAYAAAAVAIDGVRRALASHPNRLPSRADVASAIAGTPGLATPIGRIRFDAAGDVRSPIVSLYRIRGGKTTFVGQANAR